MRTTSVFQRRFLKLCKNNSFSKECSICAVIHASEVIVLERMFVHAATLWQVHLQYPKLGWAAENLSSELPVLNLCVKEWILLLLNSLKISEMNLSGEEHSNENKQKCTQDNRVLKWK